MKILLTILLLLSITIPITINAKENIIVLKWFKDELFSYKSIIKSNYNDSYNLIKYNQKIDLEDRDEVDEKIASKIYVTEIPKEYKIKKTLRLSKNIDYIEVSKLTSKNKINAKFVVIYLHGMWGNLYQGVNDYSFWWNFNRIQNLALVNSWSYISTDFSNFWDKWASEIKNLILYKKTEMPQAKIILACGSSWWDICWRLAKETMPQTNGNKKPLLDWMVIVGSNNDYTFLSKINDWIKIPIYMAHWEKDKSIPVKNQLWFFEKIKKEYNTYPIKIDIFTNWTHWTPIRMIDWKKALTYLLNN